MGNTPPVTLLIEDVGTALLTLVLGIVADDPVTALTISLWFSSMDRIPFSEAMILASESAVRAIPLRIASTSGIG